MPSKPRVVFLFRAGHINAGSKIMRCDQLCEIATEFLGDRYEFSTRALPRPAHLNRQHRLVQELKDCIVIFLKRSDDVIALENLEDLRKSVRGMAIDYVDGNTFPPPRVAMDAHISASVAGARALEVLLSGPFDVPRNRTSSVHTVLHHADPRIAPHQATGDHPNICYFGDLNNAHLPEFARKQIQSLAGDDGLPQNFFEEMLKYNMHYCVREVSKRNKRLAYKPFTKGFNAAACGANILVNRQVHDAEHFLGDDYPFLIDDLSDDCVQAGFDAARSAFGTPVWDKALDRVEHMRSKVTPREIARQLDSVLRVMM
jgi:hypothetical protein